MKKPKSRNPHLDGDALADVRRRVARDPRLRARIDASVVRATIAVMVKRARAQAGLTQAELAIRAKTTQAVVARIEGGSSFTPSLDLLDRIARALGGRLSVGGDRQRVVECYQQIDIARRRCFVARHGAEHLQAVNMVSLAKFAQLFCQLLGTRRVRRPHAGLTRRV